MGRPLPSQEVEGHGGPVPEPEHSLRGPELPRELAVRWGRLHYETDVFIGSLLFFLSQN